MSPIVCAMELYVCICVCMHDLQEVEKRVTVARASRGKRKYVTIIAGLTSLGMFRLNLAECIAQLCILSALFFRLNLAECIAQLCILSALFFYGA